MPSIPAVVLRQPFNCRSQPTATSNMSYMTSLRFQPEHRISMDIEEASLLEELDYLHCGTQEADHSSPETGMALPAKPGTKSRPSRANSQSSQEQAVKLQIYKDNTDISRHALKLETRRTGGPNMRPSSQAPQKHELSGKTPSHLQNMRDMLSDHPRNGKVSDENHVETHSHAMDRTTEQVKIPDQPQVRAVILEQLRLISEERSALLKKLKALEVGEKRLLTILQEGQAKPNEHCQQQHESSQLQRPPSEARHVSSAARERCGSRTSQANLPSSALATRSRSDALRQSSSKSKYAPRNGRREESTVSLEPVPQHKAHRYQGYTEFKTADNHTRFTPGDTSKIPLRQQQRSIQVHTNLNDEDRRMDTLNGFRRSSRADNPRNCPSQFQR